MILLNIDYNKKQWIVKNGIPYKLQEQLTKQLEELLGIKMTMEL